MRHVILPLFAALFAAGCSLGNPAERVRYDDGIYSARPYPADAIIARGTASKSDESNYDAYENEPDGARTVTPTSGTRYANRSRSRTNHYHYYNDTWTAPRYSGWGSGPLIYNTYIYQPYSSGWNYSRGWSSRRGYSYWSFGVNPYAWGCSPYGNWGAPYGWGGNPYAWGGSPYGNWGSPYGYNDPWGSPFGFNDPWGWNGPWGWGAPYGWNGSYYGNPWYNGGFNNNGGSTGGGGSSGGGSNNGGGSPVEPGRTPTRLVVGDNAPIRTPLTPADRPGRSLLLGENTPDVRTPFDDKNGELPAYSSRPSREAGGDLIPKPTSAPEKRVNNAHAWEELPARPSAPVRAAEPLRPQTVVPSGPGRNTLPSNEPRREAPSYEPSRTPAPTPERSSSSPASRSATPSSPSRSASPAPSRSASPAPSRSAAPASRPAATAPRSSAPSGGGGRGGLMNERSQE